MSALAVQVRVATAADIPAIVGISAADDEWIADEDRAGSRYAEHLLANGRLLAAEVDRVVVGFAGSVELGVPARRFTFVTDLFVDPALHGRGIGGRLLDELLAANGAGEVATFSSSDPRALPLYVRAGMRAWWPLFYVAGRPERLPSTGLATDSLSVEAAAALERDLTGVDRSAAWACWGRRPGAGPFAVLAAGRPIAVGAVGFEAGDPARWGSGAAEGNGQPPGDAPLGDAPPGDAPSRGAPPGTEWARGPRPMRLQRLVIGSDVDPMEATLAAAAHGAANDPIVGFAIPGPHPALGRLFAAGYRTDGADTHVATRPDLIDPERVLPEPSLV